MLETFLINKLMYQVFIFIHLRNEQDCVRWALVTDCQSIGPPLISLHLCALTTSVLQYLRHLHIDFIVALIMILILQFNTRKEL